MQIDTTQQLQARLKKLTEAVCSEGDQSADIARQLERAGDKAPLLAWLALKSSDHHYRDMEGEYDVRDMQDALYNSAPLYNVKPLIDVLTPAHKSALFAQAFPNFSESSYPRTYGRPKAYDSAKFIPKVKYLIDKVDDPQVKGQVCADCAVIAEPAAFAHLVESVKDQEALDRALIAIAGSSKMHVGTWNRDNILAESDEIALANLNTLLHGAGRALVTTSSSQNVLQRLTAVAHETPHLLEQAGMKPAEVTVLQQVLHGPSSHALTQAEHRQLLSKAVGALVNLPDAPIVIGAQRGFRDEILFRALQEAVLRPNPQAVKELADVIGKQNPDIFNWPLTKGGRTIIDQAHGDHRKIPEGSSFMAAAALHGSCVMNGYGYPIPLMHDLDKAVPMMVRSLLKNGASCQVDAHNHCPIEILQRSAEQKILAPGRLLEDMHDARAREVENSQMRSIAESVVDKLLNELERRNMEMSQDQVATVAEEVLAALAQARRQGVGAHSQRIIEAGKPRISDQRGQQGPS